MNLFSKLKWTALILAILLASNAALAKKPKEPPDPRLMAIESVTVIPIVDLRPGQKDSANLEKLQKALAGTMKKRGYPPVIVDNTGDAGQIAEEDLLDAKPAWIKRLGPPSSRWVMVVCLLDVHSKMTFGSTGNAEMSGFIFDKEKPELIWSGKSVGRAGQGGLLGMTMKGTMKSAAMYSAIGAMVNLLPIHPKQKK
jgi:hypothetical protein